MDKQKHHQNHDFYGSMEACARALQHVEVMLSQSVQIKEDQRIVQANTLAAMMRKCIYVIEQWVSNQVHDVETDVFHKERIERYKVNFQEEYPNMQTLDDQSEFYCTAYKSSVTQSKINAAENADQISSSNDTLYTGVEIYQGDGDVLQRMEAFDASATDSFYTVAADVFDHSHNQYKYALKPHVSFYTSAAKETYANNMRNGAGSERQVQNQMDCNVNTDTTCTNHVPVEEQAPIPQDSEATDATPCTNYTTNETIVHPSKHAVSHSQSVKADLAYEFTAAFAMADNSSKWAKLMKLSADFEDRSTAYARIIVMELHMSDHVRRIHVANIGGIAGGNKYLVNDIIFKLTQDPMLHTGTFLYGGAQGPAYDLAGKASAHGTCMDISVHALYYCLKLDLQARSLVF